MLMKIFVMQKESSKERTVEQRRRTYDQYRQRSRISDIKFNYLINNMIEYNEMRI